MSDTAIEVLEVSVDDTIESVKLNRYTSRTGVQFYGRPGTEDINVFESVVAHNEYRLPASFRHQDIIIDIGAHVGGFSYAVLTRGAGSVYAYEAHPINHAIARKNLESFGDRSICRNKAVWRSDAQPRTLYNDDITGYVNTGGISVLWNEVGVPVQTVSFDDVLFEASHGLTKQIRLLKFDCEGSEYPLLFTSKNLGVVREICGEYHEIKAEIVPERAKVSNDCWSFDARGLKDFFEKAGWVLELEPKGGNVGLFFARRKEGQAPAELGEYDETEVDVNELMVRIRAAAAAKRESDGDWVKINVSAILRDLQARPVVGTAPAAEPFAVGPPSLQPSFTPRPDKRYHVNDLLLYHDKEFVRAAYRAVLRREPDDGGYNHTLDGLRAGRFTKMDILVGLRYSPEGTDKNVHLDGLSSPFFRKLYRLPALGYLLQLVIGLKGLPALMRHQSQFEAYTQAQQQILADHISHVAAHLNGNFSTQLTRAYEEMSELSEEMSRVSETQSAQADLHHGQIGALFREHQELMKQQRQVEEEIYALVAKWRATDLQGAALPTAEVGESANARAFAEFYAAFEDEFRGSAEEVKALFKVYLPRLREAGAAADILDLGCGRGDWLELLRDEGFAARGVDSNRVLVERCRQRGLDVTEGDILAHLRSLPDATLSAVTAFHVIEHFPFETLMNLVDEVWRVLKPGGLVIFETPSPENIVVAACNFYSDPTHHKPVFPHTLRFAMNHRGFTDVSLIFLHPVEGSPFARQDLESLHMWFYGPRDYAITARKP